MLGLAGVLAVSLDQLDALNLDDEARLRAEVVVSALNALLLLTSTALLVCVDRLRTASPVMLPAG